MATMNNFHCWAPFSVFLPEKPIQPSGIALRVRRDLQCGPYCPETELSVKFEVLLPFLDSEEVES